MDVSPWAIDLKLAPADRDRLEGPIRSSNTPQKLVPRARIALLNDGTCLNGAIARKAGVSLPTVHRWQRRVQEDGIKGLLRDKTRHGGQRGERHQRAPHLAHALVLSVDEKSQIQSPERTQPGLPMAKNQPATYTHDCTRHGTTTLFAALNVLDGTVMGSARPATGIRSSSVSSTPSRRQCRSARRSM